MGAPPHPFRTGFGIRCGTPVRFAVGTGSGDRSSTPPHGPTHPPFAPDPESGAERAWGSPHARSARETAPSPDNASPRSPDPASAPDPESGAGISGYGFPDFQKTNFGLEGKSVRGAALRRESVRGGSRARCVARSGRPRRCKFRATRQICS